jgi:type VI secretion system secreted protein Hcp
MQRKISSRLVVPFAAAVITSAVVAAIALGGSFGTQAVKGAQAAKVHLAGAPPKSNGQTAGQLVFGSGQVGNGSPIQILSFAWGASNPLTIGGGSGGGGAGKVSFSSLNFLKNVDASSADLMLACAEGKDLGDATFTDTWGSGPTAATLVIDLTHVFVESIQQSGDGGAPTESISLVYTTVKWTFTDASGASSGGWNLLTNTPLA